MLDRFRLKYLLPATALLLFAQGVLGTAAPRGARWAAAEEPFRIQQPDTAAERQAPAADSAGVAPTEPQPVSAAEIRRQRRAQQRAAREDARRREAFDTLPAETRDSLFAEHIDSLVAQHPAGDSLRTDSLGRDTVRQPKPAQPFLDDPIEGKSTDSLVYDVRRKLVHVYNQGDVTYQTSNLKADYMRIDMADKMVYAY